ELLQRRAEFDGNERFLRDFREQRPKIRAIVHLAGGNPRLILMLYELLSQRQVTTIVQCLRRLVDELTPLLKDEMENLPPQQRKIIHALMEKGGTAQPTDLVERTRLPLNAITTQLKRLKDAQIVEVLGGGKGRAANYTVPDKLFAIWYQMRYLNQNRRRIELFVEVLRIWFEAEERFATIQSLAKLEGGAAPNALHEAALTTEYFAASLADTPYASEAREQMVRQWLKSGDYHEAALAHAEFAGLAVREGMLPDPNAYVRLGHWCAEHAELKTALEILDPIISDVDRLPLDRAAALLERGYCFGISGDNQHALPDFAAVVALKGAATAQVAEALLNRGVARGRLGDTQGELTDYAAVVALEGASKEQVAQVLVNRGVAKCRLGYIQGALADYTAVATLEGAPRKQVAEALVNRGVTRGRLGDSQGALADCTAVVALQNVPKDQVADALFNRGVAKWRLGNIQGALADYTAVVALEGAPSDQVAQALVNRGVANVALGQKARAITDWTTVLEMGAGFEDNISLAAGNLCRQYWLDGATNEANNTLDRLAEHLATEPSDRRALALTEFLARLASPGMRQGWLHAARRLLGAQPPEARQALGFLEPVCAIMEGGEKSLLDPLPPEQREFALKVLARFDAEKNLPAAPPSAIADPLKPGSKKQQKAAE
ncbi:MAG: winged helix-turn-helix domain-containing protein, partial [Verrucomicrobia bacterium]|nr:winged helix-turn-helix domain-containing protein [Verrucomicrobiota bacterium]